MKRSFFLVIGLLVATLCYVGESSATEKPKDLFDSEIGIDVNIVDFNAVSVYHVDVMIEKTEFCSGYLIVVENKVDLLIVVDDRASPEGYNNSVNKQTNYTKDDTFRQNSKNWNLRQTKFLFV